jgi:DNA (cytosine-5)-methyltransferase 1
VTLKGLDLFCGAGGSSAGARQAGIDIVCGIDMSPLATATFNANFPSAHVITSRLENIKPATLRAKIGDIDVLLASPECTNHTCAKGAAPRDEASRATAMQIIRFARTFMPRWLILENVVHMRPWSRYGELKNRLEKLGYNLAEQVLDASHFGVAQTRRRLFLVGDRVSEPNIIQRGPAKQTKTVRSILAPANTWPTSPLFKIGRAKGTLDRAQRAFSMLGPEASFLLVYYGTDGSGGWQTLDRPLRTITTVDRFALVIPSAQGPLMRMLQVPELQKAMGFPTTFRLAGATRRDKIRLLGNGVCPPVMREVMIALTKAIGLNVDPCKRSRGG